MCLTNLHLTAFAFDNQSAQIEFVDRIAGLIKPNGWGWIAPWNGIPKKAELNDDEISEFCKHKPDDLTPWV